MMAEAFGITTRVSLGFLRCSAMSTWRISNFRPIGRPWISNQWISILTGGEKNWNAGMLECGMMVDRAFVLHEASAGVKCAKIQFESRDVCAKALHGMIQLF